MTYNPSKWYRERNEMICADYKRGMTMYELTVKWQLREDRIRMILLHYGVKAKGKR